MDPIIALLLKNGAFGILAGVGFCLYFKERKINQNYAETYLKHQMADTAAKINLASALENLATTIEAVEKNTKVRLRYMQKYIDKQRLRDAREEGRREGDRQLGTPVEDEDDL